MFLVGVGAAMAAALLLGLLGWLAWTLFFPLSLFDAPAVWPVREHVIHPGDVVFSDLKFCKLTDLHAEIGRTTSGKDLNGNEYVFAHPTIPGDMPAGCYSMRLPVATIPLYARSGKYRVLIAIWYNYSTYRFVQQEFETEEFDVVPSHSQLGGVSSPHEEH